MCAYIGIPQYILIFLACAPNTASQRSQSYAALLTASALLW